MKHLLLILVAFAAIAQGKNDAFKEWDDSHTTTNINIPDYVDPLWSERVCTYTTTWGYLSQKCCPGWTGSVDRGCLTPICSTPCENGGVCVKPEVCECKLGFSGSTCDILEKGLCWTQWMNSDDPYQGRGDYEILSELRKDYSVCKHSVPKAIECETTGGIKVTTNTKDNLVCDRRVGLTCDNTQSTTCEDYRVRLLCPCKSTSSSKTCSYSGKEFEPQEVTTQGCHTCTCLATGDWSCSDETCFSTDEDSSTVRYGVCLLGGKFYRSFDTAFYGSQSCMCLQSGAWSCNGAMGMALSGSQSGQCITIDGTEYETRDVINNDCNKCICDDGKWECTKMLCPAVGIISDEDKMCKANDQLYQDGHVYQKDCNVCVCTIGRWDCTKFDCTTIPTSTRPETCTNIDGIQYPHGQMVNRDCNTCICLSGKWECTRRYCQPDLYPNSICIDQETNNAVRSGDSIIKDCNVCVCNSGTFTCTEAACISGNCLEHQRRYDTATAPLPGSYRPTCLQDGTYAPTQCNADNTLCFNVDKEGNRIPDPCKAGSDTPDWCSPDTKPTKTCETQRSIAKNTPGLYPPTCEPDGRYSPLQCHLGTWMCHCVDVNGITIKGTVQHISEGKPNCDEYRNKNLKTTTSRDDTTTTTTTVTTNPCAIARSKSQDLGIPSPNCQEDGTFTPMQCTSQMCYCVDNQGVLIPDTITPIRPNIRVTKPNCEQYNRINLITITPIMTGAQTSQGQNTIKVEPCFKHQELATSVDITPMVCNPEDGTFVPRQVLSEATYCVDSNGVTIPGTVTLNTPQDTAPDCEQYKSLSLTTEMDQKTAMVTPITLSTPLGPQTVYVIPEPNTTIASVTLPKNMNITNLSMCTRLQLIAITLEVPSPTCEPNGTFTPLQCTSTACYCVDTEGMTIPGTETEITPMLTKKINKTVCEKYRTVTITPSMSVVSEVRPTVAPDTVRPSVAPDTVRPSAAPERVRPSAEPDKVRPSAEPDKVRPSAEPDKVRPSAEPDKVQPSVAPDTVRPSVAPDTVLTGTWSEKLKIQFPDDTPCQQHYDLVKENDISDALDCHPSGVFAATQQNVSGVVFCVDVRGITIPGTVLVNTTGEVPSDYCQSYTTVNLAATLPVLPNPVVRPITIPTPLGPKTVYIVPDNPLVDTLLPLANNTGNKPNITYTIPPCTRVLELTAALGLPTPSCHPENGTFTPLQCDSAVCMCVDTQGAIIPGTITKKTADVDTPDCEKYRNVLIAPVFPTQITKTVNVDQMMPKKVPHTTCEKHQKFIEEHNIPSLTCHPENGTFTPMQCQDDVCYCVDMFGVTIPGTVTVVTPTNPAPVCEEYRIVNMNATLTVQPTPLITPVTIHTPDGPQTVWTVSQALNNITTSNINTDTIPVCTRHQLIAQLMKVTPPNCTKDGLFVPQQFTETVTYCVDVQGTIVTDTITLLNRDSNVKLNCDHSESIDITPKVITTSNPVADQLCREHRSKVRQFGVPSLDCYRENATFVPVQRHYDIAFCVDVRGVAIPGTVSSIGSDKTTEQTCEKFRYVNLETVAVSLPQPKVQPQVIPVTVFTPYGPRTVFMPLPTETAVTQTTTSTSIPVCIKQQQVALAMGTEPPTCQSNGTFTPLQCTKKACYCVDTQGTIVPGTAVPITPYTKTMNLNCNGFWNTTLVNTTETKTNTRSNRNNDRNPAEEICIRTRETTESMNVPNMQCLPDGSFSPLQITNNVYYCVDVQGKVVPGSLTPIANNVMEPNCDIFKKVNFTTTTAVPPMPVSLPVVTPITISTPFGSQIIYVVPEISTNLTSTTEPTTKPIVVPIATNTTVPPCTRAQQIAKILKTPSPTCQESGSFQPTQCNRDVNVCYCVDVNGVIIPDTISPAWTGSLNCEEFSKVTVINTTVTTVSTNNNNEVVGPCTRHKTILQTIGLTTSLTCHDNGTFVPMQTQNNINFCVDSQGVTVPGTITYNAEGRPKPNCELYRTVNLNTTINGTVLLNPSLLLVVTKVTVLTATGPETMQVVVATNVTAENTEIPTPFTTPVNTNNTANNITVSSKNLTPANLVAVTVMTSNGTKTVYTIKQTVNNNVTSPIHAPIITNSIVPPCTRNEQVAKILGVHAATCEDKGMYSPKQCTDSVCYCVDMMGVIVPGTLGQTYGSELDCEQYRNVVLINMTETGITKSTTPQTPNAETSTDNNSENTPKMIGPCTRHQEICDKAGIAKMTCNPENGAFMPVQCSSGVCYCVDMLGVSVPGTVTVTSDPTSMKSTCEKYRKVNMNISLNGTVIYSPFTNPIVTNKTILTSSGPQTVWGVVGTIYNPASFGNMTIPLPDSPNSSNLVPVLINSPTGPKTVLMIHPNQATPTVTPHVTNSSSNYTDIIRTPMGTINVRVTINASADFPSFTNYTITILNATQTVPVMPNRNISEVFPPQQFQVTPYGIQSINTPSKVPVVKTPVKSPYSTYPLFPVLSTPDMTQTTADLFTANTLHKLVPVTVISPNGPLTVLMPETTPLTTTNTTTVKNTTETDPIVVPVVMMTDWGIKTLWTVVNTTYKNVEFAKENVRNYNPKANAPVVVALTTNTTKPPCLRHTEVAKTLQAPEPSCEPNGQFAPLQCTNDVCYCVDINGVIIAETIIPYYVGVKPLCDRYRTVSLLNTSVNDVIVKTKVIPHPWNPDTEKTITTVEGPCTRHKAMADELDLLSSMNCHASNGTFTPLQCPDTDTCFCVDSRGVPVPGTLTYLDASMKLPKCEQYRNVNLNLTVYNNLILPPYMLPVVTNNTVLTPTGLKTVLTVLAPCVISLTKNVTQLPFSVPANLTDTTLSNPQKVATNITVMTQQGPRTVNVTLTLAVTNSIVNSTTLSDNTVKMNPTPEFTTPVRIPIVPSVTVSAPKVSYKQSQNRKWWTDAVTPNIVTPYTNMYTESFVRTTVTAPVTVNSTAPLTLTPLLPYNTTTTSTQTPWFVPYLVAKYVNITAPFNISSTVNTTEVVIGPVTVITPSGPNTVITPYQNSFVVMPSSDRNTNFTSEVMGKIENAVVTPMTYITPWGVKKSWSPVVMPSWLVNVAQTSNLPVVTPTTIATPSGTKVIYTTQVPNVLNITKKTQIVLPLVTNATETSCNQLKKIANIVGIPPPMCDEDGKFTPSQCEGQVCYCVDTKGVLVPGTVQSHRRPWCEPYKTVSLINTTVSEVQMEKSSETATASMTKVGPCTRHQRIARALGVPTMTCHSGNGTFTPLQRINDVTYCVDSQGVVVPGTVGVVSYTNPVPNCEPYRNLNLNTTINGTIILDWKSVPVVTRVTVMTPTGPKTVYTPVMTNVTIPLMTVPQTINNITTTKNVTVMTSEGVKTIFANVPWSVLNVTNVTTTANTTVPACIRQTQISKEIFGVVEPNCSPINGSYEPLQYNPVTGVYYCVDTNGVTIPNTVTPSVLPKPVCEPYRDVTLKVTITSYGHKLNTISWINSVTVLNASVSQTCLEQRKTALKTPGAFVPFCESNGTYTALQCNPNTGYCFCVDTTGHVIPQTLAHVTQGTPACWTFNRNDNKDNTVRPSVAPPTVEPPTAQTLCQTLQQTYQPIPGAFHPRCETDGTFSPVQCQDSIGYCYCVTSDGTPIPGTATTSGNPDCSPYTSTPIEEDKPVPVPARRCQTSQHLFDTTNQPQAGAVRPWCETDGSYSTVQCHVGLGYCFCVDPTTGEEIPDSQTRGRPDCSEYEDPTEEPEPEETYDCYHQGEGYERGGRRFEDCNKCWCRPGGEWICTRKKCQTGVCYKNGRKVKSGTTIKKDCNTCTCTRGSWACTEMACQPETIRPPSSGRENSPPSCANGEPIVTCPEDPCWATPRCASNPSAVCMPNYCGGCNKVFYEHGREVTCEDF